MRQVYYMLQALTLPAKLPHFCQVSVERRVVEGHCSRLKLPFPAVLLFLLCASYFSHRYLDKNVNEGAVKSFTAH